MPPSRSVLDKTGSGELNQHVHFVHNKRQPHAKTDPGETWKEAAEISGVAACPPAQARRKHHLRNIDWRRHKKAVTGFKYMMLCWPFLFIIKTSRRVLQFYVRPWIICIHIVFCVTFITFLRFRYSSICLYRKKLLFFLFFIFVDLIYENLQVCPPSLPSHFNRFSYALYYSV